MQPDATDATYHPPSGRRPIRPAPLDSLSATTPATVEDQLLQVLNQTLVNAALEQLRERERAVVILRGAEGLRWQEIQSRLGLSEGEARSAWRSARPKLTALLSDLR